VSNSFSVPAWLHDVFGETQTVLEVLLIITFGLAMTAVWLTQSPELAGLPWWKLLLAVLLGGFKYSDSHLNRNSEHAYRVPRRKHRIVHLQGMPEGSYVVQRPSNPQLTPAAQT